MDKDFAIIKAVCEHSQSSGAIKSLADAAAVQGALQAVFSLMEEVKLLREEVAKIRESELRS